MPDPQKLLSKYRTFALMAGIAGVGVSISGTVEAQSFCSEPVAPYCVSPDSRFDTELQINRCEEDLERYEEQLDEYDQCVTEQLQSLRDELSTARERLEETESKF